MLKVLFSISILFCGNFSFADQAEDCRSKTNTFRRSNFPRLNQIDRLVRQCEISEERELPVISADQGCSNMSPMVRELTRQVSEVKSRRTRCKKTDIYIRNLQFRFRDGLDNLPPQCRHKAADLAKFDVFKRTTTGCEPCDKKLTRWIDAAVRTAESLLQMSDSCGSTNEDDLTPRQKILQKRGRNIYSRELVLPDDF